MSSLSKYINTKKKKIKSKGGEGVTNPTPVKRGIKIYSNGEFIGKLKDIEEAGIQCDCPFPANHEGGEAYNYAHTVKLSGGEIGVVCSGNGCTDEDGKKACYIPKKKEDKFEKLPGKEIKKTKDPIELCKKVFAVESDDVEREELPTTTAGQPVLFTSSVIIAYGYSGVGKSFTMAKLLGETNLKYKIYLDGEGNGKALREYCENFGIEYIPANIAADRFESLLKSDIDLSEVGIIADSFSDMLPEEASNNQATDTSIVIKDLHDVCVKTKMMIIVIEHATATNRDKDGDVILSTVKLEGNESGKLKKADFVYKIFPKTLGVYEDGVYLQCMKSREGDSIRPGTKVKVKFKEEDTFKKVKPEPKKVKTEDEDKVKKIQKILPTSLKELSTKSGVPNADQVVMTYNKIAFDVNIKTNEVKGILKWKKKS